MYHILEFKMSNLFWWLHQSIWILLNHVDPLLRVVGAASVTAFPFNSFSLSSSASIKSNTSSEVILPRFSAALFLIVIQCSLLFSMLDTKHSVSLNIVFNVLWNIQHLFFSILETWNIWVAFNFIKYYSKHEKSTQSLSSKILAPIISWNTSKILIFVRITPSLDAGRAREFISRWM